MSGENITETYMKLASYGDKPELMGNDSVFCTALLRDLSARKSLTTVLSACLGEDIGNTVLNDAISKIISEKKGVVTVGVNLLL